MTVQELDFSPFHPKNISLQDFETQNKIKKELNWKPKINFSEGIKLTFDWYNNNKMYYNS